MSPVFLPDRMQRGALRLRLWEPGDAAALAASIGENRSWLDQFMPWVAEEPLALERRLDLIDRWRRDFAAGMDATYGIWLHEGVAGGCGLHQRLGPGALEIGYWVAGNLARRRVAATTAALLTQAALDADSVDRVEIHHAVENVASSGVPALLGYRWAGEEQTEPAAAGLSGRQAIWRMTAAEFDESRRERLRRITVREAAPSVPTRDR